MTETTSSDALTRRIERLERANRRFRRAGAAVLAALVAVLLMGQAPVYLYDKKLVPRAALSLDLVGSPMLRMASEIGADRVRLEPDRGQPGHILPYVTLEVEADGAMGLTGGGR